MIYPTEVRYLRDYKLLITFSNGERRVYDGQEDITQGIFARLKNKTFFARAHIERCTVVWNDELDSAPEALYAESVAYTEK